MTAELPSMKLYRDMQSAAASYLTDDCASTPASTRAAAVHPSMSRMPYPVMFNPGSIPSTNRCVHDRPSLISQRYYLRHDAFWMLPTSPIPSPVLALTFTKLDSISNALAMECLDRLHFVNQRTLAFSANIMQSTLSSLKFESRNRVIAICKHFDRTAAAPIGFVVIRETILQCRPKMLRQVPRR